MYTGVSLIACAKVWSPTIEYIFYDLVRLVVKKIIIVESNLTYISCSNIFRLAEKKNLFNKIYIAIKKLKKIKALKIDTYHYHAERFTYFKNKK